MSESVPVIGSESTAVRRVRAVDWLQNLSFAILCLFLLAMTVAAQREWKVFSTTERDIWSLTLPGWVVVDVVLALLLTPLVVRPRRRLTYLALALIAVEALLLFAALFKGGHVAVANMAALGGAGLGVTIVAARSHPGPRWSWLSTRPGLQAAAILAILVVAGVFASLVTFGVYRSDAVAYGRSPDGSWTLAFVKKEGADTRIPFDLLLPTGTMKEYFPGVWIERTVWGLFREDRVLASVLRAPKEGLISDHGSRPPARWLDNRTVLMRGVRVDIHAPHALPECP